MTKPRILIVRTSALGDIVQALPVLSALRRHYPHAHIGWVVEGAFASLLEGHPQIDELLTVRLRSWRRQLASTSTAREISEFLRRLHGFSADIVLDLMGNHKAGIIAALSMCDRRLGLARPYRREPSSAVWLSETVEPGGAHAVERMLAVLGALNLPPEPADFGGDYLAAHDGEAVAPSGPFVLLHPATGWKNKDYPPQDWARVAQHLVAAGFTVAVAPGPGEETLAQFVADASDGAAAVLPPTSLPGLVSLQRQASLVLGGDTGPVHLAHALGTAVLCVMGPTDPARHGPFGTPDKALWTELPCSFCHKRFNSTKACLLQISPETVARHALEIVRSELR